MSACNVMPSHYEGSSTLDASSPVASVPTIGVFDSGIGGLSVLRELRAQLPAVSMHYVADGAYAPYGERADAYVADRSLRIARHLLSSGARVIVVACNTATAAAVQMLRNTWPELAVVGVEPGLKPARFATRNGRIGVLATPATLSSERFKQLLQAHNAGANVVLQPCPGLAALIEQGDFESLQLKTAIHKFCGPLVDAGVDTVVLGCTHYAFVRSVIAHELGPAVQIIDTAEAVARRAAQLFTGSGFMPPDRPDAAGTLRLETTADPTSMRTTVSAMSQQLVDVEHIALD